jgi:cyclopropane fatty-acyl-phospholipid synthase-like methyltransferase
MPIPERLRWAVQLLDVKPDDLILEIGGGRGVALTLICERLESGKVVVVDRSEVATSAARRRNEPCLAAGRAEIHTAALADVDLGAARFDKVLAVNVNVFCLQPARELEVIRGLLQPAGALFLVYEAPTVAKAHETADRSAANLDTMVSRSPMSCTTRSPRALSWR